MSRPSSPLLHVSLFSLSGILLCGLLVPTALAQTSISTGSIAGTVTDATGAVLPNAKVTITGSTGQTIHATTNNAGFYSSGALIPGSYSLRVEAKGFKTEKLTVDVKVDNVANGSLKMEVGSENTVVEVLASAVQVNTEQATVQGVLTASQIENLPVNGRNFLDLAQLEPGVQIQDGQNFDPTKAGYSSISFGGRFGRTARIEVDGVDVSDETVGTTTTDIPASGIQEFSIGQASLDMSTELTSSGSVNVTTKAGTNAFHGEAFGQFRDSTVGAAALPVPAGTPAPPYQRSQYGGDFGGPILKNKLFFFLDGERTVQNTQTPVPISYPFTAYSGTFSDPFREANLLGRVDYQLTKGTRLFYRFSYFKNLLAATFGYGYSVYTNKDITRNDVVGVDFNTGSFTHSIRFSYLKFQNQIVDATIGTSLPFANDGVEIFMGATGLVAGPNLLAPQSTPQSDHEIKYDASKIQGRHIIRFGVAFNHLVGGGFASFWKNAPQIVSAVTTADIATAAAGPFPGGSANPLNYPADGGYIIGNGLGYSFVPPSLGFPAGELGPDNRILLYLGDSWKIKPNFTLTYGLRYERDTGRSDSQFAPLPGLSALIPGLGNAVRQPNENLGPNLGFAWDPWKSGKTSIRGGIGLFWENAIWNNVLFDGPFREPTGAFLQTPSPCSAAGTPATIQTTVGPILASAGSPNSICGTTSSYPYIGVAIPLIIAFQQQYQADSPFNINAPNPSYAGQYLTDCTGGTNCFFFPGDSMFYPNYRTPRSVVMNIGVQHEIRPGMVVSVDFIRNVQTHFLLGVDQNHAGDIRYFSSAGAAAAIAAVIANCGGGVTTVAGTYTAPCATDPSNGTNDGGTYVPRIATIADYAANGLGSSSDMGGESCLMALGHPCAFGGINSLAPPLGFLAPVGRSEYDGLQMKWAENVKHPFRGAKDFNFQVSYALSRFNNSGGAVPPDTTVTAVAADQDFIVPALDNANVNRYFGPSTLDRTHQLSFGGYVDVPFGFQFGVMSHFYSPLAITLTVPNTGLGPGEIFRTDFTGSGVTQDPLPGTHVGEFDRGINASSINTVITNFNNTVVGQPTPAGNVLVQNGFMANADLVALGGVANGGNPLPLAPAGQVNYPWLKAFDTTIAWTYKFKERVTIKPSIGFYNLFNFANFDLPTSMMSGLLTGTPGAINGTTYANQLVNRVGVGTGVYTLGSPRETEFGLKIIF